MRVAAACTLLLFSPLVAQDTPEVKPEPKKDRFRIGAALAGGSFDFEQGAQNDDTDAGLFRLQFEFVGNKDFGAGVRIESFVSDDDLFASTTAPTEARDSDLFAHLTWRFGSDRFTMPLRVGLLVNRLEFEAKSTNQESTFTSVGPYVELAPEITLAGRGRTRWSVYAEGGIGWGVTEIEQDAFASQKFDSSTVFVGAELGTRLALGMVELGLAYVVRLQSMERSDPEPSGTIESFDASFQGVLFSFALRF